jgi:hypothetical protein
MARSIIASRPFFAGAAERFKIVGSQTLRIDEMGVENMVHLVVGKAHLLMALDGDKIGGGGAVGCAGLPLFDSSRAGRRVRRLLSGSFCPKWAEMEGEKHRGR